MASAATVRRRRAACLAVLAPIKDTLVAKDYAVRTWSRRPPMVIST